jgi:hypothetical protein
MNLNYSQYTLSIQKLHLYWLMAQTSEIISLVDVCITLRMFLKCEVSCTGLFCQLSPQSIFFLVSYVHQLLNQNTRR